MHTRIIGDKNMYTIQEKLRGEYKNKPEEQKKPARDTGAGSISISTIDLHEKGNRQTFP